MQPPPPPPRPKAALAAPRRSQDEPRDLSSLLQKKIDGGLQETETIERTASGVRIWVVDPIWGYESGLLIPNLQKNLMGAFFKKIGCEKMENRPFSSLVEARDLRIRKHWEPRSHL